MHWNFEVMNYQQVQQRPLAANGVNRRRPDRDAGIRVDSNFRSDAHTWRSSPHIRHSTDTTVAGSHGHVDHSNTNSSIPSGSGRHPIEKDDAGFASRNRGTTERPLHDRLLFLTMCLIGQPVEVQVKNGSIYSGIFHTANAEKGFGVVLKMARLIKDGSAKVGKSDSVKEAARRAPVKTLIIYEKDFVQIIAKDVSLTADSYSNGRTRENRTEIMTDSVLSQGRPRDVERELKPWKPDGEVPRSLGLESTFQSTWNRNWDQFETNKTLFGVESTFDEELYTTKLERGPQTREREREAWRIAREIEGQSTRNVHLAEERGIQLASQLGDLDEESKFSAVSRLEVTDDAGEEEEYNNVDGYNEETFGNLYVNGVVDLASPSDSSASTHSAGESEGKAVRLALSDNMQVLSPSDSPVGESPLSSPLVAEAANIEALNLNATCSQVSEDVYREFQEFKSQETAKKSKKQREDQVDELKSFSMKDFDPHLPRAAGDGGRPLSMPESGADSVVSSEIKPKSVTPVSVAFTLAAAAVSSAPVSLNPANLITPSSHAVVSPAVSTRIQSDEISNNTCTTSELPVDSGGLSDAGSEAILAPVLTEPFVKSSAATGPTPPSTVNQSPEGISVPSISNSIPISSGSATLASQPHGLSMSSAPATNVKKSSLNPNAKEFKLNPYAKAFSPSLTAARPPSPVHQGAVYMAANLHPVSPVPLGMSQIVQQPVQPAQFNQYNSSMAVAAASVVSAAPYMQPPGAFVPGVAGAGGPPVLSGQATMKMPPQSQQQVATPYAQQQAIRYLPQAPPMQPSPGYPHPSGQLYPQQLMYGQHGPVLYIQQFPQGIMQGQPLPLPQQGPLPPQPASQQAKYRVQEVALKQYILM
ncbi:hypothetical protein O6H91_20G019100 [Diphasiastrum complanatum]|uniref:Uncharacterized protein n=1 Tax=Diphasiastrum complanatum TaxID=34168 RepID=A0ACC2AN96_DIPCM|nr:hypothetical protein O6H91_20G019100 [Diphasiastrum complanatum]